MRIIFKTIFLPFIFLLILTEISFANNNELYSGIIFGKITSSDNQPAANATIAIQGTLRTTITDENGNFSFHHVKPGKYIIEISFVGYETILHPVTVENNKTVNFSLQLKISSKQLRKIVITYNSLQNEKIASIGKANIEAKDLPQATTVIGKEVMVRQQVSNLGDVLMNVPDVYVMGATDGVQQEIGARGYLFGSTNTFKNGVQFNNGVMPEVSSLERVEFLKGSAAILMGDVTAGGVLNLVTKKPQFENGGEISMRAGSYSFYKPFLDIYGPFIGRIGKGISAQALHKTVLEILTSHGFSHSA
ncbi:MAG TPA: TonB-dependent receptor [Hanamia sp.]|nr:TonB-dependent receptor [Hanamia sp.]